MDVKEAVKKKENYGSIVTYFQNLNTLGTDQLVLLIDTIDDMSEEIFEHYKALQDIFKAEVAGIIKRRAEEGGFGFLDESQKCQLAYAVEKACRLDVLLAEKYEDIGSELLNVN